MTKDDPRISQLLAGAPPWARLLILLAIAIAGEKVFAEVMAEFADKAPDWNQVVAGQRLFHWNGKTRSQILEELDGDQAKLAEVEAAFTQHGIVLAGEKPKPVPEPVPEPVVPEKAKAEKPKPQPAPKAKAEKTDDDPFVVPGLRESDLVGRPYDELIAIEGISTKMAAELSKRKK